MIPRLRHGHPARLIRTAASGGRARKMKNASTDENLWQKAIVLGQPDIKHGYIFADKRGNNLSRPPSLHHRGAGVRFETSNNDRNNSVGPEQENGATGDSAPTRCTLCYGECSRERRVCR